MYCIVFIIIKPGWCVVLFGRWRRRSRLVSSAFSLFALFMPRSSVVLHKPISWLHLHPNLTRQKHTHFREIYGWRNQPQHRSTSKHESTRKNNGFTGLRIFATIHLVLDCRFVSYSQCESVFNCVWCGCYFYSGVCSHVECLCIVCEWHLQREVLRVGETLHTLYGGKIVSM